MCKSEVKKSFCVRWKDGEFRRRITPTMFILIAYISMGFVQAQRGSAFLDIQMLTNSTLEAASYFFTAGALGGVIGALMFGALYDRINKNLVLFSTVIGIAITVSTIPYCSQYIAMVAAWFCNTLCLGGWDATASAEIVRLWNLESQTYLFLVNFGYSIGAIIAPLATEPFLVPKELAQQMVFYLENGCHNYSYSNLPETTYLNTSQVSISKTACGNYTEKPEVEIQLHFAYTISAALAFLTSLPLLYLLFRSKNAAKEKCDQTEYTDARELPICHFVLATLIVIGTFVCISGIEDAFSSFLMTYVVKQLNWSKTSGAQLSSVFFGAYTIVRASGVVISDLIGPTILLLCSMIGLAICTLGISLSSIYELQIGVWVFVGLNGAFIGIIFPIGIAWINETVITVSGKVSSFIIVGSASGKLLNPILLGYFMEEYSPLCFCYIVIFDAAVSVIILTTATIYSHKILSKVRRRTTDVEVKVDLKSKEMSLLPTPEDAV